jgi:hypothetical protein
MQNLAPYIIRASFSQKRMTYIPGKSKVVYRSQDGKQEKIFDALEWLAAMPSHVRNKGEQRTQNTTATPNSPSSRCLIIIFMWIQSILKAIPPDF